MTDYCCEHCGIDDSVTVSSSGIFKQTKSPYNESPVCPTCKSSTVVEKTIFLFDKGLKIFKKNKIKLDYQFIMDYGHANVTLFPSWEERENRRNDEDESSQTDIRLFIDHEILADDQVRMIGYIKDLIRKTSLEKDLKQNNMFIGLNTTIWGRPSTQIQLSSPSPDMIELRRPFIQCQYCKNTILLPPNPIDPKNTVAHPSKNIPSWEIPCYHCEKSNFIDPSLNVFSL